MPLRLWSAMTSTIFPVVEKESPDRLVGFVTRTNMMKAYTRSSHPTSGTGLHLCSPGNFPRNPKQKDFVTWDEIGKIV